jgi:hypothetical protein
MIVGQFDIERSAVLPPQADPVLIVDPNAVLTRPVALQLLKPVIGRLHHIHQSVGTMKHSQFPQGNSRNTGPPPRRQPMKQLLRIGIVERSDHVAILSLVIPIVYIAPEPAAIPQPAGDDGRKVGGCKDFGCLIR